MHGEVTVDAMRSLDSGADRAEIPQQTSMEQIYDVVKAARYYPDGNCGMCDYSDLCFAGLNC